MNWDVISAGDFNRRNPCCCPVPECVGPVYEIQHRDVTVCRGGFGPFTKARAPESEEEEPYPDAFDIWPSSETAGNVVPVFKNRETRVEVTEAGSVTMLCDFYNESSTLTDSYTFTQTVDFVETQATGEAFGKRLEEWPAGNMPAGDCGDAKDVVPDGVPVGSFTVGTPFTNEAEEYVVVVTLSWTEVRHSETVGEDTVFWGSYQVLVDGASYGVSGTELEIELLWEDFTCHEFQVRELAPRANGQWSDVVKFSVRPMPCCEEPEPLGCNESTEGNLISTASQDERNNRAGTWTAEGETGTINACDFDINDIPNPTPFGLPFFTSLYITGDPQQNFVIRTPEKEERRKLWVVFDTEEGELDPAPQGWYRMEQTAEGTLEGVGSEEETVEHVARIQKEIVELTEDQNAGESTAASLFTEAAAMLEELDASWGWGMTLGGRPWIGDAAALAHWPVVGDTLLENLRCDVRQIRHRWEVPAEFELESYKVFWSYARFSEQWLDWKAAYWEWAVAKWAFVSKPGPGDADYPVIGDFVDDPETPENEAADALAAAIAALDAITDPGDAPEEPETLRPVVISDPAVMEWEWNVSQEQQEPEVIGTCDPTRAARELYEPTAPGEEASLEEIEAYEAALAEYEAAVMERDTRSERQSPWYLLRPDRWARWFPEPEAPAEVPPLGGDPTPEEVAAHALAVAEYERLSGAFEVLHGQWETARREGVSICNVRYSCVPNSPYGPVFSYSPDFPTTELPPLHPTERDPQQWAAWWD